MSVLFANHKLPPYRVSARRRHLSTLTRVRQYFACGGYTWLDKFYGRMPFLRQPVLWVVIIQLAINCIPAEWNLHHDFSGTWPGI